MSVSLLALALMTVAVLQFTVIPALADLNGSHASNPTWPAHARFHAVAQVLTSSSLGVIALYFLWSPRVAREVGVCIAMAISLAVIGGFFASAVFARAYGGAVTADRGLAAARFGRIDGNVANFALSLLLLMAGRLLFETARA